MYTIEKKNNNKYEAKITLTKEEFETYVQKTYEQTKGRYSVQGFRKGKAPRRVIEQNYGPTIFFEEALEMAFNDKYYDMLEAEKNILPIGDPEVKIEKFSKEEGAEFAVFIQCKPEVKLGAYTGLDIETAKGEITDAEVDAEIKQAQDRLARFVPVERKAKLGDIATIDFVGRTNGKEFDGGKAEDYRLELGSKSFIDTFEDQIVDMNIGEKKTIQVKFPENYFSNELKGKPAEFDVTLNKLEEKQLPELNDEFASNVSEFETLADYKADIKKHLEESLAERLKKETENKIFEVVVKNAEVEVPAMMVEEQLNMMLKDMEEKLSYQGFKLKDYFDYIKSDVETYKKENSANAREIVKTRLVLGEIVEKEKLAPTEKEIDDKLTKIAEKFNKSLEDYKKSVSQNELFYIQNDILMEKLFAFLKNNNNLK